MKPLLVHLHPDKNKFEHWDTDRYQYQAMDLMDQATTKEAKQILTKFWHNIQATNDNLCQKDDGVFLKAGHKL